MGDVVPKVEPVLDLEELSRRLDYIIKLLEERESKYLALRAAIDLEEEQYEMEEESLLAPPPIFPLKGHDEGMECWCNPLMVEEDGYVMIYHKDEN